MLTRLLQAFAFLALLTAPPAVSAATDDPFVVHEWGTFTTVQGADGKQIPWNPQRRVDLPEFVYVSKIDGSWTQGPYYHPKDLTALVRMETPVIYFYSQRERVADVRVLFRGGILTEWYPQGTKVELQAPSMTMAAPHTRQYLIEWNDLKILARDTKEMSLDRLIRGKSGGDDHYYRARETDANFLRVASPDARTRVEYERDLFYRGLGYFQAPLEVSMDSGELMSLTARETEPIDGMSLIEIRGDLMRYQKLDLTASIAPSTVDANVQPFGALADVRKLAMRDMVATLVEQGLYEKEAQAMVDTWKDQWYEEEGTRVLYLLPRVWTDRTLHLQISPRPHKLVRVMVGRAELITPSVERELRKQILTFRTGDAKVRAQAVADVRALRLGRFLGPAFSKIMRDEKDQMAWRAAMQLAGEASADKIASAGGD